MTTESFAGIRISCVAFCLLLAGGGLPVNPSVQGRPGGASIRGEYVPGEVLIRFRPSAGAAERDQIRSQIGASAVRRFRNRAEHWKLGRGLSTEEAIARLRAHPRVEYVEPNYLVRADLLPDDPFFPELWGLRNTGQNGGTPGADIHADRAWNVSTGSRTVRVAVIDSGIDYTHPDLAASIWTNAGEIPGNGIDDDHNGFIDDVRGWDFANHDNDPQDDLGHGTHVAGTIGAVGNNGTGLVGVTWRVTLVPLKFLGAGGTGTTANAVAAVDYAAALGADVMNASWVGTEYSQTLFDAIAGADGLFVAAAGNDSQDNDVFPHYPANYDLPNVLAVAATNRFDQKAGFSDWGARTVHLGAPGVDILSTLPGGRYGLASGTSMAAPHVSGAAALIRAVAPGIVSSQIRQRLLDSADRIPALSAITVSGGRLNAFLPIAGPDSAPPGMIHDLSVTDPASNSVVLTWTATGDDGDVGTASAYDVRYATTPIDDAGFSSATRAEGMPAPAPAGAAERFEVAGLRPDTFYYFALKAIDEWGNAGPIGNQAFGRTLPPPALAISPGSFEVALPSGQSTERTLTLVNVGEGTLDWRIPRTDPILSTSSHAFQPPSLPKGAPDPRVGAPVLEGRGGPDGFGYRFIDSDQPGGPSFSWTDVTSIGAPIVDLDGDDQTSGPIPLGFGMPFYGSIFSSVRVSTNGFLSFTSSEAYFDNQPLPGPGAPENLIAPFWDDLDFRGAHAAVYAADGRSFTVQFSSVRRFQGAGDYTFQVTLLDTGEIVFRYLLMTGDTASCTAGIQDSTTTIGLNIVSNANYVHDHLAVWITPPVRWLGAAPTSGRLLAGQRQDVTLALDATGLNGGDYGANIVVGSNDPDESEVAVPVHLHVTGAPDMRLSTSSLDFGSLFIGAARTLAVRVSNEGTDVLSVSGIGSDNPDYGADASGFSLGVRESRDVSVTFRPTVAGPRPGTLTITSNGAGGPVVMISLSGTGQPPPDISITPEALSESLFTGESATRALTIRNTGDGALEWSLRVALAGTVGVAASACTPTTAYVVERPGGRLSAVDLASGQVTGLVSGLGDPAGVALDRGETIAYVTSVDAGTLWGVDLGRRSATPLLTGLQSPYGLTVDAARTTAFVTTGQPGTLLVIDLASRTITHAFTGLDVPTGIALSEDETTAYVAEFSLGILRAMDLHTGAMVTVVTGLSNPDGVAFDPVRRTVYVAERGSGRVVAVDVDARTVAPILAGQSYPIGLTLDSRGGRLFLTDSVAGTLQSIDLDTGVATRVASGLIGPYMATLNGLYGCAGRFLRVDRGPGSVPPQGSSNLQITFDATGLDGGDYEANIVVSSNDPDEPEVAVPVRLHVTDTPDVRLSTTALDFGSLFIGAARTLTVRVSNEGTDGLSVSGIGSDNPDYGADASAFSLGVRESRDVSVTFRPTVAGPRPGTLTITSNDRDAPTETVALSGAGLAAPVLEAHPTTLSSTLNEGQSEVQHLTLTNGGGSPLTFQVSVPPGSFIILTLSPASGSLLPSESVDVSVRFEATGLPPGTYRTDIDVASNDPLAPHFLVPVTLTVFGDLDHDGVKDQIDNCPHVSNPDQRDIDGDGPGDACDPCTDADGDGFGDPGFPANACRLDNCPGIPNPEQSDTNDDGSGDACQPSLELREIRAVDADTLEAPVVARDPQSDPLSGTVDIFEFGMHVFGLADLGMTSDCEGGYFPERIAGHGMGFAYRSYGSPMLFDFNLGAFFFGLECARGPRPDYFFRAGRCDDPDGGFFSPGLGLTGLTLPAPICLGKADADGMNVTSTLFDLTVEGYDLDSVTLSGFTLARMIEVPFGSGLPRSVDISALVAGQDHLLVITLTDGTTVPVTAEAPFTYQGESRLVLAGPDTPPQARIITTSPVECIGPGGAMVTLDGSASNDVDSSPGTNDDIVSYEWFEDFGRPTQEPLGTGRILNRTLPLGAHRIALRVTDSAGAASMTDADVTVRDTTPPALTLAPDQTILWPPNHRLVPVRVAWQASDRCDATVPARLVGVASSEPDEAPGDGDGRTVDDIQSVDPGAPDGDLLLRAERSGGGHGRTYQITYAATDASGNAISALAVVRVPHDLGQGPEPVLIHLEPGGTPDRAHLYWNAVGGAQGYDVITGDVGSLATEGDHITLGVVRALARLLKASSWTEGGGAPADALPSLGRAFFYLVQYRDAHGSSGYGTESVVLPREPASCEGGCPGEEDEALSGSRGGPHRR